eukprot:15110155-Ditylum_brightwellii.AAC.1
MSSLHGATLSGTNGDAAAYHKGFSPSEGGEQHSGIYIKKGRKSQSEQRKSHQEKAENNKQVKVDNKANTNDVNIPMETRPTDKLLAEAATKATGAKPHILI